MFLDVADIFEYFWMFVGVGMLFEYLLGMFLDIWMFLDALRCFSNITEIFPPIRPLVICCFAVPYTYCLFQETGCKKLRAQMAKKLRNFRAGLGLT